MKLKLFSILLGATVISSAALADEPLTPGNFYFKPYIGAEYQFTHINYADDNDELLDDSLHGANIHIGARVHKHLGFELGYGQTATGKKDNILGSGFDSELKLKSVTFDALVYAPVSSDGRFELIGTAGIAHTKADVNIPGVASDDESETKPRAGAGAQYWLSDHANLRGLVRYQAADFSDIADYAIIASAGVNFQF